MQCGSKGINIWQGSIMKRSFRSAKLEERNLNEQGEELLKTLMMTNGNLQVVFYSVEV